MDDVAEQPSPTADPARRRWGAWDAVVGLLVAFVAVSFGSVLVLAATGEGTIEFRQGAQAVQAAVLIGVAFGYAIARGDGSEQATRALGLVRPTKGWLKLTTLAFFGFLAFAILVSSLIRPPEQEDIAEQLGVDAGALAAIGAGLLIVIAAPLSEEIFFRGFFFAGLRRGMPLIAAALVSGVLFGAAHLTTGDVLAFVQLSVLGALLAWLYERTGTLWSPIALHFANNAIAFAALLAG